MISNPIKSYRNEKYPAGDVTQWFGENPELYMVVCKMKSHNGIDIVAPWYTPLYAVESGTVCEVKTDPSGYGMHLRFLTGDKTSKEVQREWTYGHLANIDVKVGDKIVVGQKIANMGNTGFVVSDINASGFWVKGSNKYSGTHLHLTCREFKYSKKGWSYYPNTPKVEILNYNNGWNGAMDFVNMFPLNSWEGDVEIKKRELEALPKIDLNNEDNWNMFLKILKWLRFNS